MSRMSVGFLVGVAAIASLGAVQMASGNDLRGVLPGATKASVAAADVVNRAAKSGRPAVARPAASPSRTYAIRPGDMSNTTVLIRVSAKSLAHETQAPKLPVMATKSHVACEASVSVLTDIARTLQPGRCVT